MRVFISIAEGVMHTVHNSIGTRVQEGRTLHKKGEKIKEPFPSFRHGELFVRSIAVVEKGLAEE